MITIIIIIISIIVIIIIIIYIIRPPAADVTRYLLFWGRNATHALEGSAPLFSLDLNTTSGGWLRCISLSLSLSLSLCLYI